MDPANTPVKSRWVYRLSDAMFLRGGYSDTPYDPATEGVAEFPDDDAHPNPRLHRWANVTPRPKRDATAAEIAAYDDEKLTDLATRESRAKDTIASIALMLKRTDPNWATYTLAQKVAAVNAAKTEWVNLRVFVENNVP